MKKILFGLACLLAATACNIISYSFSGFSPVINSVSAVSVT